jgi:hypothetical protein
MWMPATRPGMIASILLAPLQLEQTAGLEIELDVIRIYLAQRQCSAGVDLAGVELIDDAERRSALGCHRKLR